MQGKAEVVIEDIAGCGKFQVIISFLVYFLGNSTSAFTILFMSFGAYNPGWRCNDLINASDVTLHSNNVMINQERNAFGNKTNTSISNLDNESKIPDIPQDTSAYPFRDNCPVFESCKDIEFDPSSVTIVSEWGLLCGKQWIPSIITSIQMGGLFVGSFLSGHIADAIGRKPTIYIAVLSLAILNAVSIFAPSWEVYAAIRAVQGVFMALMINLYFIFVAEFVPEKWRSFLQGIPAWNFSSTLFTLACMGLKNWRHITILTGSVGFVGFLPVFWIPESLRWLEVKSKTKRFNRAVKKIVRMNGKTLPSRGLLQQSESYHESKVYNADTHRYHIIHLFRNGYAKRTILLSIPWLSIAMVSYALVFGVKILEGDFYTNLIILNFINIPFSLFHIFMPNLVGRKKSGLLFSGVLAICALGAAIMEFAVTSESIKVIGIPTLIFIGKASSGGVWCVLAIYSMELYPTVIRGLGVSWGSTMARVGGILSPFLIPNTANGAVLSYAIMAGVMFIIFGVFLTLPETKGKLLRDVYGKTMTDAFNGGGADAKEDDDDNDADDSQEPVEHQWDGQEKLC